MPADGGMLITDGSHEKVGFNNYTVKRDWRRDEADEVRQEGHDYFKPLSDLALGNQPYPQSQPTPPASLEPITLTHMARKPDGRMAFLAGTPSTLYRFAIEEGNFFSEDTDSGYFEPARLGANLVTASTGSYTVNGLTIGKVYFWKKGAGETTLTHNGATYSQNVGSYDGNGWVQFGMYFRAQATSVSIVGNASPAGTIQEVLTEPYVEQYGAGGTVIASAGEFLVNTSPMFLNGMRFFRSGNPTLYPQIKVEFITDAAVVGDDAIVTFAGDPPVLLIKINPGGLTTRATVETKVRAPAVEFVALAWEVTGGDYAANTGGPYFEASGANQPYFEEASGSWKVIGSGFSKTGARWEARESNGFTVLNNGVDLPVTYEVGDNEVKPIYELREQGIAAVGSIEVYNTILMCFDVTQILLSRLVSLFAHTSSGATTASQTGSLYSGATTATQVGATNDVLASAAIFDAGMVNKTIQFENGFTTTITAFVSDTRVTLAATPTSVGATPMAFWVIHLTNDYLVNSSVNYFDSSMVGKYLFWDTHGVARKILAVNSATQARVDEHLPIASGTFKLENTSAYGLFNESKSVERIQYRALWGMPDEPRRFAASIPCATKAGINQIELLWPVKSLSDGNKVLILGAGASGTNLTATILKIGPNRTTCWLDAACAVTIAETTLQRSDAVGSIVGFTDLQGDGSPIVFGRVLDKSIVVYKDGGEVFVGRYTGNVLAPFDFGQGPVYRGPEMPYYRNTVIERGDHHVYAGRQNFYSFNLVTRRPQIVPLMERVAMTFFKEATIGNTNLIFAFDNTLTKQIFLCFPSASEDKGIAFDYEHNTVSTLGAQYTAGAAVKKPAAGIAIGVQEDWVVIGDAQGRVLQYGKATQAQANWTGASAIYHRLGVGYASRLKGGMFGHPVHETLLTGYIAAMATQNPSGTSLTVNIYGYRNPSEAARLLGSAEVDQPDQENLVPTQFLENYFQDELVCSVLGDARISKRSVLVSGVASKGFIRRET